jgi:polar amino acid transport system substrate-binding protein
VSRTMDDRYRPSSGSWRFVGSLMAIVLVAAACSSGTTPGATTGQSSSSTGQTLDAAAIALLPPSVSPGSTLKDGLEASQPPWEFVDANGSLQGIDIDIANAIAARLGLKIDIANVSFATTLPGVQDGRYDIATSGFGDNPIREKQVDMIDYANDGASLLVLAGNPAGVNIQTACGVKIAMLGNSQETEVVAPLISKGCTDAGKQPVDIVATAVSSDPVVALTSGRAVAALMGTSQAAYVKAQQPGKFEIAPGGQIAATPTAMAVALHSPLDPAILKVLTDMKADGSYDAIMTKWGVAADEVTSFGIDGAGAAASSAIPSSSP